MKPIASPTKTKQILEQFGISLKKSLGQNFVVDANILKKMVQSCALTRNSGVIEIGAGIGSLTEQLAEVCGKVITFEIDSRMLPVLRHTLRRFNHVQIVHQDIMEADLHRIVEECLADFEDVVVCANLPYYVTTPILFKLLQSGTLFREIDVMIQKEVAERLEAAPGTKDYGSLTLAVQYFARPEKVMKVPRTVFRPMPAVDSAVVKLVLRKDPPAHVLSESFFFSVIRASFSQRRKTIFNNLVHNLYSPEEKNFIKQSLENAGIEPDRRAETLSLSEFARLSNTLYEQR